MFSLPLDLGFLSLTLLLDGPDLLVGHEDGRILFTATHAGRLAPAHLHVEPTALPWEDTDTVRLAIVRTVNEARGLAPARPVTLGRAGVAGDFFLARPTAQDRRDAQRAE